MQSKNTLDKLLAIMIIAVSLITLLHVLRLKQSPILPTYDLYQHIIDSKNPNPINPLNHLITHDYKFYYRIIPFIAGIVSIVFIYIILKKILRNNYHILFSILIFVLSPNFIYLFGIYNSVFLFFALLLLSVAFLLYDNYLSAAILFIISFFINQELYIVILLLLLIIFDRLKSKNIIIPLIGIVLGTIIFINLNGSILTSLTIDKLIQYYISDFGADPGLGIFSVFIGIIGIIISWKDKKNHTIFYYTIISLALMSLYNTLILIFLDMLLIFYGGYALSILLKSRWSSPILKNYVLILAICGLLFSSGSYIKRLSEAGPYYPEILSLKWLKTKNKSIVLSHYEYGFLIEAISEFESYTDKSYFLHSKDRTRIQLSNEIFQSRNLNKIKRFFDTSDIRYIWINKAMKQGQVWEKSEQGIVLILENSREFKKIYNYLGIEIWEYED